MELGTKTKKKLSESVLDKFSMDFLRNQVLKTPTATTTPSSLSWTPAS